MAVRFNPPPGWQVPPGFRPDAGWAPDPAWPPAPPGWDYWVDDAATARPVAAAPSRAQRQEAPAEATSIIAPVRTAAPAPARQAPPAPMDPTATTVVGAPVQTLSTPAGATRASRRTNASVIPLGGADDPAPAAAAPTGGGSGGGHGAGSRSATARPARPSNMVIGGVAAACLALGCILGVTVSMMRSSDAAQARVDARTELQEAENLRAEAAQERQDLENLRADVTKREEAVKQREEDASAKEADLTSRQKELDEQKTQQEQQPQQPETKPGGGALFYWDCNAARQDGAAPIPQGQAAYRRALDPNGNGIACEDGE